MPIETTVFRLHTADSASATGQCRTVQWRLAPRRYGAALTSSHGRIKSVRKKNKYRTLSTTLTCIRCLFFCSVFSINVASSTSHCHHHSGLGLLVTSNWPHWARLRLGFFLMPMPIIISRPTVTSWLYCSHPSTVICHLS